MRETHRSTRRARAARLLACAALAWLTAPPARAEVRPLSLYQKVARSSVALWGEVVEADRYATLRVLEVIKCSVPERPGPTMRIAYRLDSFLREPWQDKIEFRKGERVLLFVRPFTKQDGERTAPDLFALLWGAQGKVVLPAEGEEAWVGAARRMSEILAMTDLDAQALALEAEIASPNPHVSEAALSEILEQRLAGASMVPKLLPLLDSPREPVRLLALKGITAALQELRAARLEVPGRPELADRLRGRASTDATVEIRVEAIRALTALGGEEVRAFLELLAREDPSQLVRLEASRSVAGWRP